MQLVFQNTTDLNNDRKNSWKNSALMKTALAAGLSLCALCALPALRRTKRSHRKRYGIFPESITSTPEGSVISAACQADHLSLCARRRDG